MLEIRELKVSYDPVKAINGIDLAIKAGESVAVTGESGAGKTTLGMSVMRLGEGTVSGQINFQGRDLLTLPEDDMRRLRWNRMAMVFQNPGGAMSHRLTVLETVREPLDVQRISTSEEREDKVRIVLREVELPEDHEFLNRYPHQLSGGEIQRVVIARAMILDPRLIIADEPTAFLDASVQAKVLRLFLNLQEQRGLSLLFITHDIAVARKVSDRIAVMRRGEIVEVGPSHRVVEAPAHEHTRSLLTASALLEEDEAHREFSAAGMPLNRVSEGPLRCRDG